MLAENGSQLLLDMMKEKTIEDQRIIVPINLIERESSK
jgi:DNA-binding LacI/PurR family transcriptional regulator